MEKDLRDPMMPTQTDFEDFMEEMGFGPDEIFRAMEMFVHRRNLTVDELENNWSKPIE